LQPLQQKYIVPPPTSERYRAVATFTAMPQTGSTASGGLGAALTPASDAEASMVGRAVVSRKVAEGGREESMTGHFSLRCNWMISARMLTAISVGVTAPMSRPAGALSRPKRSTGTPRRRRLSTTADARLRLAPMLT
jgi:hypothetical protein